MKCLKEKAKVRRAFMLAGALAAIFALAACDMSTDDDTSSDTSSDYTISGNTYTVYTAAGLLAWNEAAQLDPTLSCILANDIDMEGYGWIPVGDEDNPYMGTFDGRGHVISNIAISGGRYVGLFGRVGNEGAVKNLGLKDAKIFGGGSYVGSIAGINYGSITFCYVTGGNVTGGTYTGGIAGYNYNMIIGCYFTGDVTGYSDYTGGLVGGNYAGAISASYASAAIVNESSLTTIGIFAGSVGSSSSTRTVTVAACYWEGTLNGAADNAIGENFTSFTVTEVDGTTTWQDAVTEMNERIVQYGWRYELGSDGLPYLTNGM